MSLLAKADAAQAELAVDGVGTTADLAARVSAHLELRLAGRLVLKSGFAISVLLEGEAEVLQERVSFRVVLGGGHHSDVHTAHVIDRIRIDLMEHGLLGETKVVVALAIELVTVDTAEVADTGQRKGQQTIQELPTYGRRAG